MTGKVLVVDNDAATRFAVCELLEELGRPCVAVESGPACLAQLVSNPTEYAIVLMEIHMPVLSGIETISWLRKSEVTHLRTIPVYAMTADHTFCDATTLKRHALSGLLRKPITRGELEQVLMLDEA